MQIFIFEVEILYSCKKILPQKKISGQAKVRGGATVPRATTPLVRRKTN